jgi:hypothetical protein
MFQSLRSRLILASLLWTGGLLMLMHILSMLLIHALPRFRSHEAGIPSAIGIAVMAAALWWARRGLAPCCGGVGVGRGRWIKVLSAESS